MMASSFPADGLIHRIVSQLQQAECDVYLILPGIDGRYARPAQQLMSSLLHTQFGSELQAGKLSEEEEECVCIVSLVPHLHVRLICPHKMEVDISQEIPVSLIFPEAAGRVAVVEDEMRETFKIRAFIEAFSELKSAIDGNLRVAVPTQSPLAEPCSVFPQLSADSEIEQWPLIQAFALQDFSQLGFFTMAFDVRDASAGVQSLLAQPTARQIVKAHAVASTDATAAWKQLSGMLESPSIRHRADLTLDGACGALRAWAELQAMTANAHLRCPHTGQQYSANMAGQPALPVEISALDLCGNLLDGCSPAALSGVSHLRVRFLESCTGVSWTRCIKLQADTQHQVDDIYESLTRVAASFSAACSRYLGRLLPGAASADSVHAATRKAVKTALLISAVNDVEILAQAVGVDCSLMDASVGLPARRQLKSALNKQQAQSLAEACCEAIIPHVTLTTFSGIGIWSSVDPTSPISSGSIQLPAAVLACVGLSLSPDRCTQPLHAWAQFADTILLTPGAQSLPMASGSLQSACHSVLSGDAPSSHACTTADQSSAAPAAAGKIVGAVVLQAQALSVKQSACECGNSALWCSCVAATCAPQLASDACVALLDSTGALSGVLVAALTDSVPKLAAFTSSSLDVDLSINLLQKLGEATEAMELGPALSASATAERPGHVRVRGGTCLDMLGLQAAGCLVAVTMDASGQPVSSCSHSLASLDIRKHGIVAHTFGTAPVVISANADISQVFSPSSEHWLDAASQGARAGLSGVWASLAPLAQFKQAVACMATKTILASSSSSPASGMWWKQLPRAAFALGKAAAGDAQSSGVLRHFTGLSDTAAAGRPFVPRVFGFHMNQSSMHGLASRTGMQLSKSGGDSLVLLVVLHPEASAVAPMQAAMADWSIAADSSTATVGGSGAAPLRSMMPAVVFGTRAMVGAAHAAVLRAWAHASCFDCASVSRPLINATTALASGVQHTLMPVSLVLVPCARTADGAQAAAALCAATAGSMHWVQVQAKQGRTMSACVGDCVQQLHGLLCGHPALPRAGQLSHVMCTKPDGSYYELLDSHAESKQIGVCIQLPPFVSGASFAAVLGSSCGIAAAAYGRGMADWPLQARGLGKTGTVNMLLVLRGIIPVVDITEVFHNFCTGLPSAWLVHTCKHPATRYVLDCGASLHKAQQDGPEECPRAPVRTGAGTAAGAVPAPPLPGSALASVLAAGGASPFARRAAAPVDAQIKQAEDEQKQIKEYHERKRRQKADAFPGLQLASLVRGSAQALLQGLGVTPTAFTPEMGINVTHAETSVSELDLRGYRASAPTVTLTTARLATGSLSWPEQPHFRQTGDVAPSHGSAVTSFVWETPILLLPLLEWLRKSLSAAPAPLSPAAALVHSAQDEAVASFEGHLSVLAPGGTSAMTVFIQGTPARGVWLLPTAGAQQLGVPPLGHVLTQSPSSTFTAHSLQTVLSTCRLPAAPVQPAVMASQLSRAARLALVKHRREEPLPEGIMFDGQCFRDPLGRTLLQHPRQDDFVSDFLKWANVQVAAANAVRSSGQAAGSVASYLHCQQFPELEVSALLQQYVQDTTGSA